ncbi:MAG TPA: hypothetical protein VFA04_26660 [Bryobacteraceae bacterium]|nr:hypothetical protein [Bryobacteraceae bacterium]
MKSCRVGQASACGGTSARLSAIPLLACALALAGLAHADTPRIIYSKAFKGSKPDYVSITLDRSGRAVYREAPNDANPLEVQVPSDDVNAVFGLAAKLENFAEPLESHLKVAFTGTKTFVYENGSEKHETSFNYSQNPDARLLADWFERLSETEQRYLDLDQAMHFDKLGVNDALLQVNILWDQKRLVTPQQFLPLLHRISINESYMHIARERAATLADQFEKPPAQEKSAQ